MGVTLKNIAERAGVSLMTVSRVVNNSGPVSDGTRAAVEAAIDELGYRPNLFARGLINRKSSVILVIVPDIANPFFADLTKGVEWIARNAGYSIILGNSYWQQDREAEILESATGRMAEAVIMVLPQMAEDRIERFSRKMPLVVVDRQLRRAGVENVFIDQQAGAARAVDHLIELGHRDIAFLAGRRIYNSRSRFRGFRESLEGHKLPVRRDLLLPGDFSFESGQRACERILAMPAASRPTALFAASDMMALGFMRSAFRHHYPIPEAISVVGFDDIFLASVVNPPLTTVRHPYVRMGEVAMKRMAAQLSGGPPPDPPADLVNELVVRETTAPRG